MFHRTRWHLPALVAGTVGATGALANAAEPTQQELVDQIRNLQQQVDELKAATARNAQATQASTAPNTYDSVLRDAEQRSAPLMQAQTTDFTAGYKGGKFTIQSPDGNFSLSPNFQLQVRNVTNYRDLGNDENTTENGFELRRAKFGFTGNMFTKDLTYEFLWETNRNTGAVSLQDGWARYKFVPDWSVRVGQFKDPLGKEQSGSSKRLLAAERSLLNELLIGGDDYVQGATMVFAPAEGRLKAEFGVTDGSQNSNSNFRDTNAAGTTPDTRPDWGVAGRAEYQLIGTKFKGNDDYTGLNQSEDMLVFGAGADITETGDMNVLTYTVDGLWKNTHGTAVFGEVIGRLTTQAGDVDDLNDIGFLVQAAQMLGGKWMKAEWEVFGRYDVTIFDSDRNFADDDIHEITLGVNGYFHQHASKVTLDFNYLPNGCPNDQNGAGYLPNSDSQFVIRAQYQLLI